jgi:hypothetical protein
MRIVWELQASLALELQVIQGIKRLNVADIDTVSLYVDRFSDYVEGRDFNLERTSCGRIANIYWQQIRILESGPGGEERAKPLDELLQQFADADRQFTEEIEPFMNRALAALKSIRGKAVKGNTEAARAQQAAFVEQYREEVVRLKTSISAMSKVGESLLARL